MKDIWKLWQTARFIGFGYFQEKPKDYEFKFENRRLFAEYLENLEGEDIYSKQWHAHLYNINYYADTEGVLLLEDELEALKTVYNDKEPTTVHEAVDAEEVLFGKNASEFEEDTPNYDLRKYRPGSCFLPDGNINLKRKQ